MSAYNGGCPLKIVKCLLTSNIQLFLYAVIKLKVVNQAILISSSVRTLMLFVCYRLSSSIDSFKDVIQYCIVYSVRCRLKIGF